MSKDNSHLQLKELSHDAVKDVARSLSRNLSAEGCHLSHAKALELVAKLAGHANWRSLKSELDRLDATRRTAPVRMDFDEFCAAFEPRANDVYAGGYSGLAEGFGYGLSTEELAEVQRASAENSRTVWTVVIGEDDSTWVVPGYHVVNRDFYLITKKPWEEDRVYEIPFSHSLHDRCWLVRVTDYETGTEHFREVRYIDGGADEAAQSLDAVLRKAYERVRAAGRTPLLTVTPREND